MTASTLPRLDPDTLRAALVARRAAVRAAWDARDGLGDALVFLAGGLVLAVEGSDQHYGFRAHDDHYYLCGARGPGQVLVLEPAEGWTLFAPEASQEDRVWHGATEPLDALGARVGIERVRPLEELGAWLGRRAGHPGALLGSRDILERPIGYGLKPGALEALAFDADLSERLEARVHGARRCKDDVELTLLRAAAACSRAGHLAGLRAARPGVSERAVQVEIEAAFQRAGAERPAYGSIVAGGPNAAVLHATPGGRAFADGDLVLVDAGAEYEGYDSDVTRTWPLGARFTASQRAIYELVLDVQRRAIEGVAPGVEYRELHLRASRDIAAGLVEFGLLRGDPDGLVEQDTHALFFPHGVGHMLGLATHDVGGWVPGRERSDRPGLKYLRIDTPLQTGDVVTIEPGIYFVRALLCSTELRAKHRDAVNWDLADAMLDWGGVRIEDDVLVTAQGPQVLTHDIPKSVDELEALRA